MNCMTSSYNDLINKRKNLEYNLKMQMISAGEFTTYISQGFKIS